MLTETNTIALLQDATKRRLCSGCAIGSGKLQTAAYISLLFGCFTNATICADRAGVSSSCTKHDDFTIEYLFPKVPSTSFPIVIGIAAPPPGNSNTLSSSLIIDGISSTKLAGNSGPL